MKHNFCKMEKYLTLLYYKFARIEDAEAFAARHLKFCKSLGLVGRILIGEEGINGTVSGTVEACEAYMESLSNDPLFAGIEFKVDEVGSLSFSKMHVRAREEIITFGEDDIDPTAFTAPHLSPEEVKQMKDQEDVVFLDTRNVIEYEVGKFKDARVLNIHHFRDFADHLDEVADLKDKTVIAYCTGGIRCEKATAYMLKNGFKKVYQIDGGIIKYGKEVGGEDFEGKCYVFDQRLTVDVNSVNPSIISHCKICEAETVKLINCANPECNEHFCICESCADKMEGCCSADCQESPNKRVYDGSGYYIKGNENASVCDL